MLQSWEGHRDSTSDQRREFRIDLVFSAVGEEQINRSMTDYLEIARRLPPLRILVGLVNEELRQRHARDEVPLAICRFRPRDRWVRYDPVPSSISAENDSARTEPRGHENREAPSHAKALTRIVFYSVIRRLERHALTGQLLIQGASHDWASRTYRDKQTAD
jgi:hypothetical protein